jgi:hypothetical protein
MCCLFLLRFLCWFVFRMCGTHPSPNPNLSKLISNSPCYQTVPVDGRLVSCFVFSCCLIFVVALWLVFLFKMRLWYASPFYFLSCICFVVLWCVMLWCVLLMFWGLFCYTSSLFFCSWLVSHFWAASGCVSTNAATPEPDIRQLVQSKNVVKKDIWKRKIEISDNAGEVEKQTQRPFAGPQLQVNLGLGFWVMIRV